MTWTIVLFSVQNFVTVVIDPYDPSDMQPDLAMQGSNSNIPDCIKQSSNFASHHPTSGKFISFFQLEFTGDFHSIQTANVGFYIYIEIHFLWLTSRGPGSSSGSPFSIMTTIVSTKRPKWSLCQ